MSIRSVRRERSGSRSVVIPAFNLPVASFVSIEVNITLPYMPKWRWGMKRFPNLLMLKKVVSVVTTGREGLELVVKFINT